MGTLIFCSGMALEKALCSYEFALATVSGFTHWVETKVLFHKHLLIERTTKK